LYATIRQVVGHCIYGYSTKTTTTTIWGTYTQEVLRFSLEHTRSGMDQLSKDRRDRLRCEWLPSFLSLAASTGSL
jgi:hypothetical protein